MSLGWNEPHFDYLRFVVLGGAEVAVEVPQPARDGRYERFVAEQVGVHGFGAAVERIHLAERRAGREDALLWRAYRLDYLDEMRASYRSKRAAWDALLAMERVVLLCFCTLDEHERCHRIALGQLILPKLGAIWCGEITLK